MSATATPIEQIPTSTSHPWYDGEWVMVTDQTRRGRGFVAEIVLGTEGESGISVSGDTRDEAVQAAWTEWVER